MEVSKSLKYVIAIAMALWEVLGWMLALTGLSKIQETCDSQIDFGFDTCTSLLRQSWWSMCFQLGVLVGICVVLLTRKLGRVRPPVVAFLGMSTMKLMTETELMLDVMEAESGVPEEHAETAFVGFVLMCILNFVLIMTLGMSPPPETQCLGKTSEASVSVGKNGQQKTPESHSASNVEHSQGKKSSVISTGASP